MTANFQYNLSYAGVPLLLDTAKVVRLSFDKGQNEGIVKNQPVDNLISELNRLIPYSYLEDFHIPSDYLGRNLEAIATPSKLGPWPNPKITINDWYYPTNACRWSVFRGLVWSSALKSIISNLTTAPSQGIQSFTGQGGWNSSTFVMQAGPVSPNSPAGDVQNNYTLETSMFMLPPRPLAEHGAQFDGLYLITLVDERYYFDGVGTSYHPTKDSTWYDILFSVATALGIQLFGGDPIPEAYATPEPDSQFWENFENAAVLLDAAAYNIGRVVVRNLDGTYSLKTPLQAQDIVQANLLGLSANEDPFQFVSGNLSPGQTNPSPFPARTAGGDMYYSGGANLLVGDLTPVRNAVCPAEINVTFPLYVQGDDPVPHFVNPRYQNQRPSAWYEESYGDIATATVPISSGGNLVSGLVGTSQHTIHTTAKALYDKEADLQGNPLNFSGLTSMAMQIATDYWGWKANTALDEVFPGTWNWLMDGAHDVVWSFSARRGFGSTRVMRTQWNLNVPEMQHSAPALSGYTNIPRGVGGLSVAQTWQDGQTNIADTVLTTSGTPPPVIDPPISTQLAATLLPTDSTAYLIDVKYLPTQNRWRMKVENEILLMEGTSGGLNPNGNPGFPVNIVYHAVDNTLPAQHDSLTTVSQVCPNTSYGVNRVRFEKMQFAYPDSWTSGGVQGHVIVPQTQTVFATDGSGHLFNGTRLFSGFVETYDPTLSPPWDSRENVWLVLRNSGLQIFSGYQYGGQLVGYSASGPVAPIYAIDDWPYMKSGDATGGNCCSGNLTFIANPSLGACAVGGPGTVFSPAVYGTPPGLFTQVYQATDASGCCQTQVLTCMQIPPPVNVNSGLKCCQINSAAGPYQIFIPQSDPCPAGFVLCDSPPPTQFNFSDSCSISWSVTGGVAGLQIKALWEGFCVDGAAIGAAGPSAGDCRQTCDEGSDGIPTTKYGKVDSLKFNLCDFATDTATPACCGDNNTKAIQIETVGATGTITLLDSTCNPVNLCFLRGLLKDIF